LLRLQHTLLRHLPRARRGAQRRDGRRRRDLHRGAPAGAAAADRAARPARVISFPRHATPRTLASATVRVAPRWIAAAAAAGLFIGVALGASYEWEWHAHPRQSLATAASRLAPVATRGSGRVDVAADDAFLSELDAALERPRTRELIAYDALTPHVREVNTLR
jgi:hypothetical protein